MSNSQGKQKIWDLPLPKSTSTMSLPRFRSERPRLYWPLPKEIDFDKKIEIKIEDPLEDPHKYGVKYLTKVVGSSGDTIVTKGKVLKANHQQELVAVKIMTIQDQKIKEAYIRELRILQKIIHPHIIATIGSCSTEVNGKIRFGILLFPLAETNLEDHLGKPPKTFREIERLLSFFPCLCQAVNYLHTREKPIKHRDIKPSNILIGGAGEVMLADFGISKQYDDKAKAITIRGMDYTVKYAPRHVVNQSPAGLEWDINCLGFVFVETATVIFGETIENLLEFLHGPVTSLQSIERTTSQTTSEDITEVSFATALEEERIDAWLGRLRTRSDSNLARLPEGLAHPRQSVDAFSRMVDKMMRTPKGEDDGVLAKASRVFASMSEVCEYCHPTSSKEEKNPNPLGNRDRNLLIGRTRDNEKVERRRR